jgi:glycosyltransferase involved in cell wall biosynthesis
VKCRLTYTSTRDVEITRKLVADHALDDVVVFREGYNYEDLPALLADADVYVSTSLWDGTSNSLLEAMSTGTFPVVTNIPANVPWVEHGKTGFLFAPGDDAALAECLERALNDTALRARTAKLNRERVIEHGDVQRQADRLLDAFQVLLEKEA